MLFYKNKENTEWKKAANVPCDHSDVKIHPSLIVSKPLIVYKEDNPLCEGLLPCFESPWLVSYL